MSVINNQVKQTYNSIGVYFSRTRTKMWPEVQKWVDELVKGESVLDAGCGNGRLLTGVMTDISYIGVDNSEVLIKEAQRLHPKKHFEVGDITEKLIWNTLPKFDKIFCIAVLHHIATESEQRFILKQVHTHLNSNGTAYITVWNLNRPKYWQNHLSLLKLKNIHWLTVPFQKQYKRFCFAFSLGYLKRLLIAEKFKIEDIYYANENGMKTNWLNGQNLCAIVSCSSSVI